MNRRISIFLDYLEDNFHDRFKSAILRYLLNNRDVVESRLRDGCRLQYINLEGLDYQFVRLEDKGGNDIEFDVVIIPEIECNVIYGKYRDRDIESPSPIWISVTCSATISSTLDNFKIIDIGEYSRRKIEKPLTDDLIPIISKAQYDSVAEEILSKYYPIDINQKRGEPIKLDIIAENMGIRIAKYPITKDKSIFGQAYFTDVKTKLYHKERDKLVNVNVPKNTLLYDAEANSLFSLGCQSFTIAHELIHFYLHRKAFSFAQLFNQSLSHIQCHVNGNLLGVAYESRNNWMEIQANGIAPCLLMPKSVVAKRVGELEKYYKEKGISLLEYSEKIVKVIAKEFDVSIYTAKKRLYDLGYKFVEGTFNWVDGHYVRAYICSDGTTEEDETYTVSVNDFCDKIFDNSVISILISQGKFAFVENHLCIDKPQYIETNSYGESQLTDYARAHIEECCVKFKCKSLNGSITSNKLDVSCYLCRECISNPFEADIEFAKNSELLKKPEMQAKVLLYSDTEADISANIAMLSFGDSLRYILKKLDVQQNALAIDAEVEEHTISRYCNGKSKRPQKGIIIALCVALHLPVDITRMLLNKAGLSLNKADPEDRILDCIISTGRHSKIKHINALLEEQGFKKLTSNF